MRLHLTIGASKDDDVGADQRRCRAHPWCRRDPLYTGPDAAQPSTAPLIARAISRVRACVGLGSDGGGWLGEGLGVSDVLPGGLRTSIVG